MNQVAPAIAAAAPPPARVRRTYTLRELGIAPENLRAEEPPDAEIPQLAETIAAAGLLQPLTVRPGRGRREKPAMALDGRRRLLALRTLAEAGRIGEDYPVEAFVETEPARQAAAVVLTNTAAPVHVADVIVAIGRMLKGRLSPAVIAGALGYAEVEVRRLAALSALPAPALEGLRQGRITLRQARLLARLRDPAQQAEIARRALDGFGFQEWRVAEQLDEGRLTERDPRLALVGADRYAAAGGRTEADLFGERPSVLLDARILQDLWERRAGELAGGLAAEGRAVEVCADEAGDDPSLEPFGYRHGLGLDAGALEAWRAAEREARQAAAALDGADLASPASDPALAAFLAAALRARQAAEPGRAVTRVVVTADARTGLDIRAWGPPEAAAPGDDAPGDGDGPGGDAGAGPADAPSPPRASAAPAEARRPVARAPAPDLEGVGHALHEARTDVATRALVRALADDPAAALVALAARLFCALVLDGRSRGGSALSIQAEAYGRVRTPPIEALDGDVRRRLADRRAAWEASGLSPIAWAAGLSAEARLELLAELVGLSLDLREERTTGLRPRARAEAVEIAALCGADVTRHWVPDAGFLAAHPKGRLLAMLDEMGAADIRAGALRKDQLVSKVAELAAERRWAPAFLSWRPEPEPPAEPGSDGDPSGDEADADASCPIPEG